MGLLGASARRPAVALWLPRTRSVHTIGMRVPIDVAHVGPDGHVLDVVTPMRPWRLGRARRTAAAVLEAPAGSFATWGLARGSHVACA